MEQPAVQPLVDPYNKQRLSEKAVAAQAYRNFKMREGAAAEATKQEQAAAEQEAQNFIDGFLDDPVYQLFAQLLESKKTKDINRVAGQLVDRIDQLASKSKTPETKTILDNLKKMMILEPLAKKI